MHSTCKLDEAYDAKCISEGKDSDLCEGGGGGGGNCGWMLQPEECSVNLLEGFCKCPAGQFCNMESYFSGTGNCELCKECTSTPDAESCYTCGLPWEGADQCFEQCSKPGALTQGAREDNCIACPCGFELELIDHCKTMDSNGACTAWCDTSKDADGMCTQIVEKKFRNKPGAKCKTMKATKAEATVAGDFYTSEKPRCVGKCVPIGQATCPMKKVLPCRVELLLLAVSCNLIMELLSFENFCRHLLALPL